MFCPVQAARRRDLNETTASTLNSRENFRRSIPHLQFNETPNLGVHQTAAAQSLIQTDWSSFDMKRIQWRPDMAVSEFPSHPFTTPP